MTEAVFHRLEGAAGTQAVRLEWQKPLASRRCASWWWWWWWWWGGGGSGKPGLSPDSAAAGMGGGINVRKFFQIWVRKISRVLQDFAWFPNVS